MRTNNLLVRLSFPVVLAYNSTQAQVEVQLYHLEASYLTETTTNSGGNIITGFENYLKNQGIGRRKFEVTDSDRMFSASSTTYQRVCTARDVFYMSGV
jgi:chromatin modification-related protein EAF6